LYHTFYFDGQLAVVKQGAVHTYLSQLQLIPGPFWQWRWSRNTTYRALEDGPGISLEWL